MLQSMRSVAKYIWIILIAAFVGSFLLYETSGLAGLNPVTTSTAVATVNGEDILLTTWQNAVNNLEQSEAQRLGSAITLDQRRALEDNAFEQLVNEVLLQQEFKRRGITVTDDEILQAARVAPPPQAMQSPELMTDGQFDIEKYRRLLGSSMARQSGMLVGLEAYYRSEIPKQKLFDQVSSDVFLTDERVWQTYKDRNDSTKISYVVLRPDLLTDTTVDVSDAEISQFYERNKKRFEVPGRAVVSLLSVPRAITASDSVEAKARIEKLRTEIVGGAKFEDVARRESNDSVSGAQGGALGKGVRGRFTPKFDDAAYSLAPGELSQPVLTPFGWHIMRVDSRKGDTLDLRHILINVVQSDSSATRTDRRADSLAAQAGSVEDPKKFDDAAKALGLTPFSAVAIEKEPMTFAGRYVPSVSAWAFSGVRPGETSDLFDSPDAYYIARLDSLKPSGTQSLAEAREEIRGRLARDKRIEKLRPIADQLLTNARSTSLEAAAQQRQLAVQQSDRFTRIDAVPGLGQFTKAIGAAFTVPVGQVGGPFAGSEGMIVMRVDARSEASKAAFEAQKDEQRAQLTQSLRQQRVEEYLKALRENVKVDDHRTKVMAQLRRQTPT